jgi:hypothetical protein
MAVHRGHISDLWSLNCNVYTEEHDMEVNK